MDDASEGGALRDVYAVRTGYLKKALLKAREGCTDDSQAQMVRWMDDNGLGDLRKRIGPLGCLQVRQE